MLRNTRFYKGFRPIPSLGFQEKTLGFHQFWEKFYNYFVYVYDELNIKNLSQDNKDHKNSDYSKQDIDKEIEALTIKNRNKSIKPKELEANKVKLKALNAKLEKGGGLDIEKYVEIVFIRPINFWCVHKIWSRINKLISMSVI